MEIEVGKHYRTRCGLKAQVLWEHTLCRQPCDRFLGFLCDSGRSHSWAKDGSWCGVANQPLDLIAEWKEQ